MKKKSALLSGGGAAFGALAMSVFAAMPLSAERGDAVEFFLKPGAPEGDGSMSAPFGSFAAAQTAVRKAVADPSLKAGAVSVTLLDGKYFINKEIRFAKEDSGTAAHPVKWRAKTRGGVRLTGGIPVPKLKKLTPDDPAWARIPEESRAKVGVADLKAAGISDYGVVQANGFGGPYMELVWDGKLQTLARWPNDGFTGIASVEIIPPGPDGKKIPAKKFVYADDRPSRWVDEPAPYGNGFFCYNWAAARVAFKSIDPATKTIEQQGRGSSYGYSKIGFWFGYNLLCELDSPGEYYIDRSAGRLYYWPTTNRNDPEAALTTTCNLFMLNSVSNVSFSGLVFENCRGTAFSARGGEGVQIVACTFRNVGSRAVTIDRAPKSRVAGCDISYCGAGGVTMAGGDMKTLSRSGMAVENCHIHHYALLELTYAPAVRLYGCGIAVRHCTIHDGPHTAVLFGGREHDISWNEIHSVCLDAGEMGAVYCGRDWTLCGNRIDANYFHDIYNPRNQRNRAIMLDDGAAGITMTSNRFVRVAEAISLSAIGNVIENNLFQSNFPPISAWQKWENHDDYTNPRYTHKQLLDILAALPVHKEPWKSRYPYLGMIDDAIKTGVMRDPATRTAIRRNIAFDGATNLVQFMYAKYAYTPETWLVENNTENDRTPPKGFAPLPPCSAIGVQNTPERATWPIDHPVTIKCSNLVYRRKQ
jgi:hypothetical protein